MVCGMYSLRIKSTDSIQTRLPAYAWGQGYLLLLIKHVFGGLGVHGLQPHPLLTSLQCTYRTVAIALPTQPAPASQRQKKYHNSADNWTLQTTATEGFF